jgi:hypothetical protein
MSLTSWYGVPTLECALSSFEYRAYESYITKPQSIVIMKYVVTLSVSKRGAVGGREK